MNNNSENNNWTEEETRTFRELGAPRTPGAHVKARVVQSLSDAGLLSRAPRRTLAWMPWATAAALAVIGFSVGRESVRVSAPPSPTVAPDTGQKYVLLLNGAGSTTPSENAARRKEYGDWLRDLSKRGMGVDGQELVGERHDLPEGPGGPPVVGYFVITARTEAEALEVARTTPHLRHGGGVTVSAIR